MKDYFHNLLVRDKLERNSTRTKTFIDDVEKAVSSAATSLAHAQRNGSTTAEEAVAILADEIVMAHFNRDYDREKSIKRVLVELSNDCYSEGEGITSRACEYQTRIVYQTNN